MLAKLEARVPDKGYQQLLNRLKLGPGRNLDAYITLFKENLKAVKKLAFKQIKNMFEMSPLDQVLLVFVCYCEI